MNVDKAGRLLRSLVVCLLMGGCGSGVWSDPGNIPETETGVGDSPSGPDASQTNDVSSVGSDDPLDAAGELDAVEVGVEAELDEVDAGDDRTVTDHVGIDPADGGMETGNAPPIDLLVKAHGWIDAGDGGLNAGDGGMAAVDGDLGDGGLDGDDGKSGDVGNPNEPDSHGDDGDGDGDGSVNESGVVVDSGIEATPRDGSPACPFGRVVFDEFPVPRHSSFDYLHGIVAGPDGAIWFTELYGNRIGRIDQAGHVSEFMLPEPGWPAHITVGPDGRLWFTEMDSGRIGSADLDGTIVTSAPIYDSLYGIALGPDDNLWFPQKSKLSRLSGGTVVDFRIASTDLYLGMVTAGPDGNLWFVESDLPRLGRIAPDGTDFTEFDLPDANPIGLVNGPDGRIWFADYHGRIGRITVDGQVTNTVLPTAGSCPVGIAATRCDIWYTDNCAGRIGRVTLDGTLTELSIPTAGSRPVFIATAPDGTIWFTENVANHIVRIRLEPASE